MITENNWKSGRRVRITSLSPNDGIGYYFNDIVGLEFVTGERPCRFYTNPSVTYTGTVAEVITSKHLKPDEALLLIFSKDTQIEYLDMEERPKFRIPDINFWWASALLVLVVISGGLSDILDIDDGDKGAFGTAWDSMLAGDVWAGFFLFFSFILFGWVILTVAGWIMDWIRK